MKVAVTGATGFVGGHVLARLLAEGHEVRSLVRQAGKLAAHPGLVEVAGSLQNQAALDALVMGCDGLIHLAGAISGKNREAFMQANVAGTENVLKAAKAAGVQHIVHVSSLAARRPEISWYAESKRLAEQQVQGHGLSDVTTILRAAAVYGEGDQATLPLLKALLSRVAILPGIRHARFGLVHVHDLAHCCVAALDKRAVGLFDVDDGYGPYAWHDLIAICRHEFSRPSLAFFLPRWLAMIIGQGGDVVARLTGKASMINGGKMRELYAPDWTVQSTFMPEIARAPLRQALPATITWFQQKALLPQRPRSTTSTAT